MDANLDRHVAQDTVVESVEATDNTIPKTCCESTDCEAADCTCTTPTITKKTKKRKARSIEALEDLSPRSMSETEMRNYIEFLRGERNLYKGQALAYENNADSAFKAAHVAEDNAKRKVAEIAGKLEFAKQAISTCYASILYASKGE